MFKVVSKKIQQSLLQNEKFEIHFVKEKNLVKRRKVGEIVQRIWYGNLQTGPIWAILATFSLRIQKIIFSAIKTIFSLILNLWMTSMNSSLLNSFMDTPNPKII